MVRSIPSMEGSQEEDALIPAEEVYTKGDGSRGTGGRSDSRCRPRLHQGRPLGRRSA